MPITGYSLFVLKVPLNPKLTNNLSHLLHEANVTVSVVYYRCRMLNILQYG